MRLILVLYRACMRSSGLERLDRHDESRGVGCCCVRVRTLELHAVSRRRMRVYDVLSGKPRGGKSSDAFVFCVDVSKQL